jgi:phosphatidylglycerol:prolipoprotein diacylglycerol transferase
MRPVLFRWRGFAVHAYPACLYLGLVAGTLAGRWASQRAGLDPISTQLAILTLVPVALVGARLWFVALHWRVYRRAPHRVFRRSEGGAALYGGLFLALAGSPLLLRALALPLGAFWDVATFVILVGMVPTKIGCLLNGCCAGRPTAGVVGLQLPDHRGRWQRRWPTQLLEAAFAIALLLLAATVWGRLPAPGLLFLVVVLIYAIGRAALEATRATIDRVGHVSVNQALSAGLALAALGGLALVWP